MNSYHNTPNSNSYELVWTPKFVERIEEEEITLIQKLVQQRWIIWEIFWEIIIKPFEDDDEHRDGCLYCQDLTAAEK